MNLKTSDPLDQQLRHLELKIVGLKALIGQIVKEYGQQFEDDGRTAWVLELSTYKPATPYDEVKIEIDLETKETHIYYREEVVPPAPENT